jgi:hypothetical protein
VKKVVADNTACAEIDVVCDHLRGTGDQGFGSQRHIEVCQAGREGGRPMNIITRGFRGRRQDSGRQLPPGQYLTRDFPVLSAGPTPRIPLDAWGFTVTTEQGDRHRWSWTELMGLAAESITTDIHCVTRWSKLDTAWRGVSLDTLLSNVETEADFVLVHGDPPAIEWMRAKLIVDLPGAEVIVPAPGVEIEL